jgi:hypothetical protein
MHNLLQDLALSARDERLVRLCRTSTRSAATLRELRGRTCDQEQPFCTPWRGDRLSLDLFDEDTSAECAPQFTLTSCRNRVKSHSRTQCAEDQLPAKSKANGRRCCSSPLSTGRSHSLTDVISSARGPQCATPSSHQVAAP